MPARNNAGQSMGEDDYFDLTPGQLLMWLGMQQRPDVPVYNMVSTFRIRSELDTEKFAAALRSMIAETDALRCVFTEIGGVPKCRVRKDIPLDIEVIDLSSGDTTEPDYRNWLAARTRLQLPLGERSYDTILAKLGPADYVWYLNQHHLITDAWSTRLVYERVVDRYRCLLAGVEETVDGSPRFADYVRRLDEASASERFAAALAYWRERAAQMEGLESLVVYGRTHDSSDTAIERVTIDLDQTTLDALENATRDKELRSFSRDVTLFQVFMTVLVATLYRAGDRSTVAVAAPAINRSTPVLRKTAGLLMEIFSLQIAVDTADSLADLYVRVVTATVDFFRHSHPGTSNAKLLRHSNVLLNFVRSGISDFNGAPVDAAFLNAGAAEPHSALRVQVRDLAGSGALSVDFDFNCGTFDERLREIFVGQFRLLLDAFLHRRQQPIAAIDLLSSHERSYLLDDLNNTAAAYPQSMPLHAMFEQQASQHPQQPAVVDDTGTISYADLNRRADLLALELAGCGVVPGDCVGLFLDRGIDYVLGLLAVLKAGAAFLPIDTQLPRDRRAMLLERGQQTAIICASRDALPAAIGIPLIVVAGGSDDDSRVPAEYTRPGVTLDDLAYVLYTSGSTGVPKGVACRHRGVVNLLYDFEQRKALKTGDHCSLWTGVGFDVSIYEIFSALAFGGTLHVVPELVRPDSLRLFDWLCERGIASAYLPPFVLQSMLDYSVTRPGELQLERLLVGVEPIPQSVLAALSRANPQLVIINGYGPTETAICATLYTVPDTPGTERRAPIGRPVRNNQLYVVDHFRQLLPFGVPGELLVGGDGVARGYLDEPDPARESFINNPFDPANNGRLYCTGDIVRYLPDGNLQFVGRVDHQLKIRGHRVEPLEIESRLAEHPAVQEALVVAVDDDQGNRSLAAYLVATEPLHLSAAEWFERLRNVLPGYMIPASFTVLDVFPQTPNGKIDRKALPEPSVGEHVAVAATVAPRTLVEAKIAELWCDVLGLSSIGVHDHFIDLGGESIEALKITARAQEHGIEFTAQELFEYPTVAMLAPHVREAGSPGSMHEPPIRPAGADLAAAASQAGIEQHELDSILAEFGEDEG